MGGAYEKRLLVFIRVRCGQGLKMLHSIVYITTPAVHTAI